MPTTPRLAALLAALALPACTDLPDANDADNDADDDAANDSALADDIDPSAAPITIVIDSNNAANRSTTAPFVAFNAQGAKLATFSVDQTTSGGKWVQLGAANFTTGWNKVVLSRQRRVQGHAQRLPAQRHRLPDAGRHPAAQPL